ncbi:hypothetical protein L1N85_21185 [Paenibacillus alkaliterrae]|uniref:hypothetical protein n=1 Tax=Paenibacillus alkaliterrae TaxID=320909 RepID=UPI001F1B4B0B|nr:hypothetical protein [Paenibacillus alkaliterrae]MCF2940906.1 hypothetical protein [Paenibacillus alkaliterrae]
MFSCFLLRCLYRMFEHIRLADFNTYADKRYGIATGASTTGIVYNKKAFAAGGRAAMYLMGNWVIYSGVERWS